METSCKHAEKEKEREIEQEKKEPKINEKKKRKGMACIGQDRMGQGWHMVSRRSAVIAGASSATVAHAADGQLQHIQPLADRQGF